ncbi:hypothetical protein NDU88_000419 [Pleurodeles waltl]|uniref:G-protein coupled receptors family 1 profile domain-containing protein n=1 Tax=Pleurodeles waltl TaxID=8319 RepID=A0AAV7P0T8_PLEWA|nr:hypothetical protein NDU88_000419 [Pleurodeles waltl]
MSFLDICSISVTLPKAIANHMTGEKFISSASYFTQDYFFMVFVSTEAMLLTAMGYDRYVAVCNPLRYATVMSGRMCAQLAAISWPIGMLDAKPDTLLLSSMSFCGHQDLNHFFCDLPVLTQLTCSDNTNILITTFTIGVRLGLPPCSRLSVNPAHDASEWRLPRGVRDEKDGLHCSQGNGDAGTSLGNLDIQVPYKTKREDGLHGWEDAANTEDEEDAKTTGREEKGKDTEDEERKEDDGCRNGSRPVGNRKER